MTSEQLQNALGFSKSYVNRKIREGMPTDTVEFAEEWLERHSKRGKPGNRSNGPAKSVATVVPVEGSSTLEDAVRELQASERAVSNSIREITAELLKTPDNDEKKKLSNQLADLRQQQKQIVGVLAKAENDLVKLQKSRGQLISLDDAKSLISKALASAVTVLKRIPQSGQTSEEQNRLAGTVDVDLADFWTAQEFVAEVVAWDANYNCRHLARAERSVSIRA